MLYGSDLLGVWKPENNSQSLPPTSYAYFYNRKIGNKQYSIKDHLGNVRVTFADKKIPANGLLQDFVLETQSVSTYYPFGWEIEPLSWAFETFRFGFNGKEKDGQIAGGALDYGARIYSSKIGRWLSKDSEAALQPGWSTYKFALDNPMIFVDPGGNTEFYYKGEWVGTDGKENNLIAKVNDKKVASKILKLTKKGMDYEEQSISKAAESKNGMIIINKDVLGYSNKLLKLSLGEKGKTGEYANTMVKLKDGSYIPTIDEAMYNPSNSVEDFPLIGDVSIHSHPTGMLEDGSGRAYDANDPSDNDFMFNPITGEKIITSKKDEFVFGHFETNIIVGKNGLAKEIKDANGFGTGKFTDKHRGGAINFFGKGSVKSFGTVGSKEADTMLSGDRGENGKKYNEAKEKNAK